MNGQKDRGKKGGKTGKEEGKIETERRERDSRKPRRLVNIQRNVRGRQKKVDGG